MYQLVPGVHVWTQVSNDERKLASLWHWLKRPPKGHKSHSGEIPQCQNWMNCFIQQNLTRLLLLVLGSLTSWVSILHQSVTICEKKKWFVRHLFPVKSSSLDKMATIVADDIFKCIFVNEKDKSLIQISLKLVPRGPIDNKPALVQIMVWRRTSDKPLPEPMMAQFTDASIYGTRGRWVKIQRLLHWQKTTCCRDECKCKDGYNLIVWKSA